MELITIKSEILKKGYVDVKIRAQGIRQSHRLYVKTEKMKQGVITYLDAQHYIPTTELVRLANELGFPIKHRSTLVFPKGKMPKDFIEQTVEIEAVPNEVEAEIES